MGPHDITRDIVASRVTERAVEATSSQISLATLQNALAGRYAFERELGRGGMATVYLARDLANDRHVAVKVLLPELAVTLGMAGAILLEAAENHKRILRDPSPVSRLNSMMTRTLAEGSPPGR